jgi:hypothetical protein
MTAARSTTRLHHPCAHGCEQSLQVPELLLDAGGVRGAGGAFELSDEWVERTV